MTRNYTKCTRFRPPVVDSSSEKDKRWRARLVIFVLYLDPVNLITQSWRSSWKERLKKSEYELVNCVFGFWAKQNKFSDIFRTKFQLNTLPIETDTHLRIRQMSLDLSSPNHIPLNVRIAEFCEGKTDFSYLANHFFFLFETSFKFIFLFAKIHNVWIQWLNSSMIFWKRLKLKLTLVWNRKIRFVSHNSQSIQVQFSIVDFLFSHSQAEVRKNGKGKRDFSYFANHIFFPKPVLSLFFYRIMIICDLVWIIIHRYDNS